MDADFSSHVNGCIGVMVQIATLISDLGRKNMEGKWHVWRIFAILNYNNEVIRLLVTDFLNVM